MDYCALLLGSFWYFFSYIWDLMVPYEVIAARPDIALLLPTGGQVRKK